METQSDKKEKPTNILVRSVSAVSRISIGLGVFLALNKFEINTVFLGILLIMFGILGVFLDE